MTAALPMPYTGNFKFTPEGVQAVEYRVFVGDLISGLIWTELPYIGIPSWNDYLALGTSGSMKIKCPLSDPRATGDDRSLLRLMRGIASGPWRYIFILMLNEEAIFAGPLMTHQVSADKAEIEFGIGSINAVLDKRVIVHAHKLRDPHGWDADIRFNSPTKINWIATQLLYQLTKSPTEFPGSRSIPFTASVGMWQNQPIGTETREYRAFDLGSYYEALKKLTETDDGPDIYFKIVVNETQSAFWWDFRCGDPYLGQMDYPWTWDYGVNCLSIAEDSDASKMANRAYVPGDGQDDGKIIGYAENMSLVREGFPGLEVVPGTNNQEGKDQRAVNKAAAGYVSAYHYPSMKWSLVVDPHQWPMMGEYEMGDTFRLSIDNHHWIESGEYYHRIVGYEGDTSKVSLLTSEFQWGENIAARAY